MNDREERDIAKAFRRNAVEMEATVAGAIAALGGLIEALYRAEPECRSAVGEMLDKLVTRLIAIKESGTAAQRSELWDN